MDARTKKVPLAFMGEGWDDCYVEMRFMKWADYKRFTELEEKTDTDEEFYNSMIEKVKHVFVSGQVLENGTPVALTVEGVGDFDYEAIKYLNNAALGYTSPKE